jgi:hypothetical protein
MKTFRAVPVRNFSNANKGDFYGTIQFYLRHQSYNGQAPVTSNYGGQEPPPEKPTTDRPVRQGSGFATGWDLLSERFFTLWQGEHNTWMMAELVHALIWQAYQQAKLQLSLEV